MLQLLVAACWLGLAAGALAVADWDAGSSVVRCFCNHPSCVATGYMCKSSGVQHGGCYSDFVDYADVQKARHGCLELLDSDRHEQCRNQPNPGEGPVQQKSLLLCCHKDMCNHVDSPEIRLRFNDTFLGTAINSSEATRLYFNSVHNSANSHSSEVWFKAATIAVPICGVVVLCVLIILAVKMLRKDNFEQGLFHNTKHAGLFPHTGQSLGVGTGRKIPHEHLHFHSNVEMSSKKVPLLLQHHSETTANNGNSMVSPVSGHQYEKNETNAKLNFSHSQRSQAINNYGMLVQPHGQSSALSNCQKSNNNSNSNLYRNVNLAVTVQNTLPFTPESKLYDKQQFSSVVSWGNSAETASHV